MAEQGGADVDGEAAVDDLGGEEPSEVVRREGHVGEGLVGFGELLATAGQHVDERGRGYH
ncbi:MULTISPECIES: hypothetical protein [unclassified Streptomyces]|uniref:hypothetical protein n=1 Tax=unclassified Streptomyces TaxID=2593676 RepID=UPI00364881B0